MDKNEHLELDVSMKRNFHPYLSSTYINGYVKDQSLKNMNVDEVLFWFSKVNKEFGKRPMKHNGKDRLNVTGKESIQGQWNETMWNQYPKHLMEPKITIPSTPFVALPLREIKEKKVKISRTTKIIRKKYAIEDKNT